MGEKRICLFKKDLRIIIVPNADSSSIEVFFEFNSLENPFEELKEKSKIFSDTIKEILVNLPTAKITLDIFYSVGKYITNDANKIKEACVKRGLKEKNTLKNSLRKFEVLNKRNVTTKVDLILYPNYVDVHFKVDVENIIVNLENIESEIINSVYFYYLQYIKLHYFIVSEIDNEYIKLNEDIYNRIREKL